MPDNTSSQVSAAIASFGLIFGIISIVTVIFAIIIWWRIFSKAGYSGAMGLLMFVPIANLVMLLILAFGEWPIYTELNQLRAMRNQQYQQYQQYSQNPQNLQYPQNPQNPQYPQSPSNPQYRG